MKFTLLLLTLIAGYSSVAAQQPMEPANCESDIAILDTVSRQAGEDGLIIVIARLGDGESNRELNHRRLYNVRTYLTEWDGRRNPKTVITAEGERINGYGRIELYVGGKLFYVLLVRRNADLIVGSCTYEINSPNEQKRENNLYPWRDRFQRKSKRKGAR
ncbi:MAG: hypothetical protein WKF74_02990 [Pyrinomonadaceae bacterium]